MKFGKSLVWFSGVVAASFIGGLTSVASPNAAISTVNPNGTPNAYDGTSAIDGAFLAGPHIYSFSAPTNPIVFVPEQNKGAGFNTQLILQIETLGSEPDLSSIKVTSTGGSPIAPSNTQLLSQSSLGGFGGFQDDYQFTWNLPGNASGYTFSVTASDSSMSWAGARVDSLAKAVPEPAVLGLVVISLPVVLRRARKQTSL